MADIAKIRHQICKSVETAQLLGYQLTDKAWGVAWVPQEMGDGLVCIPGVPICPLGCVGVFLSYMGPVPQVSDGDVDHFVGQMLGVGREWCFGFANGFAGNMAARSTTDAFKLGLELRGKLFAGNMAAQSTTGTFKLGLELQGKLLHRS